MFNLVKRNNLIKTTLAAILLLPLPAKASGEFFPDSFYYSAQRINDTEYDWLDNSNNSLQPEQDSQQHNSMSQINSVDRLRDVSPVDWAYEALNNLVSRYNCITGFPNNTYRGNQPVTRYEFAAGLNSCLSRLEKIIAASEQVETQDIEAILRLMQDFQAELAIIRGKTDGLQARIGELELTQFSTTTKLAGEVIFGIGSVFAGDNDSQTVFGDRVRLELNTSFSGKDLLFTRLSTGNFPSLTDDIGFQGDLGFVQPEDNDIQLEVLLYSFSIGSDLDIIIGAAGTAADDIVSTVNALDGDGGSGAVSLFGTRNPIYLPPGDTGLGISYSLGDSITLGAGYLSANANLSTDDNGLFESPYSAIAQVLVTPTDNFDIAFTYVHSRNQSDTETGSQKANIQSLTASTAFPDGVSTVSDSYGIELSWAISDRFILGGWGALSKVTTLSTLNGSIDRGTQDIWNTALTLALPDLGKEGSLGGVIVGIEPTVTDSSIDGIGKDEDLSLHVEAFYQYQVNNHIAITPGVVWITAPDNNDANEDLVIGTIRTTFSF